MFKKKISITRIEKSIKEELEDVVLIETPVYFYINNEPLVNIICLPIDLKELAIGFLFSNGLINSMSDINQINFYEPENKIYIDLNDSLNFKVKNLNLSKISRVIDTTGDVSLQWQNTIKDTLNGDQKLIISDEIKISPEIIFSSFKQMQIKTTLYRETGGCHGAAIFDLNGKLLGVKEDVGRHNAIDKIIGEMILRGYPFKNTLLTSTGRLTGDSVFKAVRAKIPIVASISAAIESGIKLATAHGITLIGFVRDFRMNIYTCPFRIKC
ncbi:MAG: formate dehydrogenase accessory sulfurtransferase FdhD [Promethearchaeota archaeon]